MTFYTCAGCFQQKEREPDRFRVICEECSAHAQLKLTREQYKAWLIHNRARISNGLPFVAWDDNTVGDKDTYASWGMCSGDVLAYPDPETWEFGPTTKPNHWDTTRIRVLNPDHGAGHYCPFDRRLVDKDPKIDHGGCFWSCRIFKGKIRASDREEALHWFDVAIEKVR